jgi:hypothetical protein
MTAFNSLSCNPLDLILIVKNAAITFNASHSSNDKFNCKDAAIAAKKNMRCLYAVHKKFIKKIKQNIDPDNKEL